MAVLLRRVLAGEVGEQGQRPDLLFGLGDVAVDHGALARGRPLQDVAESSGNAASSSNETRLSTPSRAMRSAASTMLRTASPRVSSRGSSEANTTRRMRSQAADSDRMTASASRPIRTACSRTI